ncbi:MAG: hypothetical protein HDT39_09920 [Lachnospiraceae bacterium]|nr:hypothetical protein [Lachnospiraceae bacterium]
MTKYLQIRHWNYWWGVYGYANDPATIEFSITEDSAGEQFYFHLDIDTLPALKELLKSGEFIDKHDPSFQYFQRKAAELHQGSIDYFVGSLYYKDYMPDMAECNRYQQTENGIFSIKSPEMAPYYAAIFIREEKPLLPALLTEWMERLSPSLFCEHFTYKIANIPSREDVAKSYAEVMQA